MMDLVRELKTLNARKKAGEALPPADEARRKELKAYSPLLAKKPEVVALNKIDVVTPKDLAKKLADFKKRLKITPVLISGATGKNVDATMKRLLTVIQKERARGKAKPVPGVKVESWQP